MMSVAPDAARRGWIILCCVAVLSVARGQPATGPLGGRADPEEDQSVAIQSRAEDSSRSAAVAQREATRPTPLPARVLSFPSQSVVGFLMPRKITIDDYQRPIEIIAIAQGDVEISAGTEVRLEVDRDVTDFSFLAELEPGDIQLLRLWATNVSDKDLVYISDFDWLEGLDIGSTGIGDAGLEHLEELSSLEKLTLFNTAVTDAGLIHLSRLHSLKRLSLYGTHVEGPGLMHLKGLTSLVKLDLAETPITNDALLHIKEMPWLEDLALYDTDVGGAGLAHISGFRSLERLVLGHLYTKKSGRRKLNLKYDSSSISDADLHHLAQIKSLKNLSLYRTRVTDDGLSSLAGLSSLEGLDLRGTQITGRGLGFIKNLPLLHWLGLNDTGVTAGGLAHLKLRADTLDDLQLRAAKINDYDLYHLSGLTKLKYLTLDQIPITDAGLEHLRGLSSLTSLSLRQTNITHAGLRMLQEALPETNIIHGLQSLATPTPIPDHPLS